MDESYRYQYTGMPFDNLSVNVKTEVGDDVESLDIDQQGVSFVDRVYKEEDIDETSGSQSVVSESSFKAVKNESKLGYPEDMVNISSVPEQLVDTSSVSEHSVYVPSEIDDICLMSKLYEDTAAVSAEQLTLLNDVEYKAKKHLETLDFKDPELQTKLQDTDIGRKVSRRKEASLDADFVAKVQGEENIKETKIETRPEENVKGKISEFCGKSEVFSGSEIGVGNEDKDILEKKENAFRIKSTAVGLEGKQFENMKTKEEEQCYFGLQEKEILKNEQYDDAEATGKTFSQSIDPEKHMSVVYADKMSPDCSGSENKRQTNAGITVEVHGENTIQIKEQIDEDSDEIMEVYEPMDSESEHELEQNQQESDLNNSSPRNNIVNSDEVGLNSQSHLQLQHALPSEPGRLSSTKTARPDEVSSVDTNNTMSAKDLIVETKYGILRKINRIKVKHLCEQRGCFRKSEINGMCYYHTSNKKPQPSSIQHANLARQACVDLERRCPIRTEMGKDVDRNQKQSLEEEFVKTSKEHVPDDVQNDGTSVDVETCSNNNEHSACSQRIDSIDTDIQSIPSQYKANNQSATTNYGGNHQSDSDSDSFYRPTQTNRQSCASAKSKEAKETKKGVIEIKCGILQKPIKKRMETDKVSKCYVRGCVRPSQLHGVCFQHSIILFKQGQLGEKRLEMDILRMVDEVLLEQDKQNDTSNRTEGTDVDTSKERAARDRTTADVDMETDFSDKHSTYSRRVESIGAGNQSTSSQYKTNNQSATTNFVVNHHSESVRSSRNRPTKTNRQISASRKAKCAKETEKGVLEIKCGILRKTIKRKMDTDKTTRCGVHGCFRASHVHGVCVYHSTKPIGKSIMLLKQAQLEDKRLRMINFRTVDGAVLEQNMQKFNNFSHQSERIYLKKETTSDTSSDESESVVSSQTSSDGIRENR